MEKDIINRLNKNQIKDLRFLGSLISKGESVDTINKAWDKILTTEWSKIKGSTKDAPLDINTLVQYVLGESYTQSADDLSFHAKKVQYFNQQKKKIREHIVEIRTQSQNLITDLEKQLATIEDMSQSDVLDLQEAMTKQQQAYQMISNVMKTMHDTAKAIISNLR